MKEVGSDFGAGGVEIGVEQLSTAWAKRSVTGGPAWRAHCKNTRAAVCNIDPDQLARLALLPLSDGCWGSDGAGKTKILKSNDVDKQKASNSVGHRRTICQGMLRRKTELTEISFSDFLLGADRRHRHCLECLPSPHGRGLGWSYVGIHPKWSLVTPKVSQNTKKGGVVQFCLFFGADTIDIVWHAYLLLLARVRLVGPT